MDADRFDTLLRTLSTSPTRRGALRLLAGTALAGLLAVDTGTADAKKGGGKGNGGKKGKGKKRGHKKVTVCHKGQTKDIPKPALTGHLGHGDSLGPCGSTPPPGPTCSDQVKNGSETDVDCGGGTCPRCVNEQKCVSQDDCASALCVSGVCKTCGLDTDCGIDAAGSCICRNNQTVQQQACMSSIAVPTVDDCDQCADDEFCDRISDADYKCRPPCGAV
jgi:hypothetical protein